MQTHATMNSPRSRLQDDRPSALSYWGSGLLGIATMLAICFLAGLRF